MVDGSVVAVLVLGLPVAVADQTIAVAAPICRYAISGISGTNRTLWHGMYRGSYPTHPPLAPVLHHHMLADLAGRMRCMLLSDECCSHCDE